MEEICLDFLFVASAIHLALSLSLFHFMLRPPLPSFFSAQPEAIFGSPGPPRSHCWRLGLQEKKKKLSKHSVDTD